jgi:hypothetical protein
MPVSVRYPLCVYNYMAPDRRCLNTHTPPCKIRHIIYHDIYIYPGCIIQEVASIFLHPSPAGYSQAAMRVSTYQRSRGLCRTRWHAGAYKPWILTFIWTLSYKTYGREVDIDYRIALQYNAEGGYAPSASLPNKVLHPFDTGCLPLDYCGSPGVTNCRSDRGANFGAGARNRRRRLPVPTKVVFAAKAGDMVSAGPSSAHITHLRCLYTTHAIISLYI